MQQLQQRVRDRACALSPEEAEAAATNTEEAAAAAATAMAEEAGAPEATPTSSTAVLVFLPPLPPMRLMVRPEGRSSAAADDERLVRLRCACSLERIQVDSLAAAVAVLHPAEYGVTGITGWAGVAF